jgi:hypothetical protein
MDLPLNSADHRQRFAEVGLRMPRIVAQRYEHLAQPQPPLVHAVLYDRDPAAIAVLVAQPLEDPLRGMLLFGRLSLIFFQDPLKDTDERVQLRPCRRPAPPVPRRHRERQHLRHRPRVDPEPPRRLPSAQPLHIHRPSHLPVKLHALHPSTLCPSWQKACLLPEFCSGAAELSGRLTEGFSLRRSQLWSFVYSLSPPLFLLALALTGAFEMYAT